VSQEIYILVGSAAALGAVHTLFGPDHYVPFVALSKARQWSLRKTLWITGLCGFGHIAGSVALGFIGIALGIGVRQLELVESQRGDIAAWLLVGFGLAYATWGTIRALRNKPHTHRHVHADGLVHSHTHSHQADHMHPHGADGRSLTPWILFTIFVFGPCEPLIPLLMYPAAALSPGAIVLVAVVFGAVTVATMLAAVSLLTLGLTSVSTERLGRLSHPLAGVTILLCGVAIFLGL
jgi:sulfite exporter TauE/SafE